MTRIKKPIKEIGLVIEQDNARLDTLNDKLGGTNIKIEQTQRKLNEYLKSVSTCKLWIIILIEIFVFLFLISI